MSTTYEGRHADASPFGARLANQRDENERRHKVAPHTGRHRCDFICPETDERDRRPGRHVRRGPYVMVRALLDAHGGGVQS